MAPEIVSDDDSMEVAVKLQYLFKCPKNYEISNVLFFKVVNGKKVKRKRGKVNLE